MSDSALSSLPGGVLSGESALYVVDSGGNSRKVTLSSLAGFVQANSVQVSSRLSFQGALVSRSNPLDSTDTVTPIEWDTEIYDTGGFWDAGSPSVLTIPSGVSRVRFYSGVAWLGNSATTRFAWIRKTGGDGSAGYGRASITPATSPARTIVSFQTGILPVSAGDSFFVEAQSPSVTTGFSVPYATWFSVQVITN
jgi:hypothetical protein